ncbi:MAG TPA: hypothetical protein VFN10_05935 [Thermoanaerobaculia bacterium]|nr:hypothetical protein [Thermoanaerobaculia bacterium]
MPAIAKTKTAKTITIREKKIAVSETNLRKAATRLLTTKLVSTEVAYIQRELGTSASQEKMDAAVVAVRTLPWSTIAIAD